MTTKHKYGIDVVEFIKHDSEELQKLLDQRTSSYFMHSESPAYPQLGAHIDWISEAPLTQALNSLLTWTNKGYTIASAINKPLWLKTQLKKPEHLIDADLVTLQAEIEEAYEEDRYARNIEEHNRQVGITLARETREREAAAATALAKQLETARQQAHADLIAAYSKPARAKPKNGTAMEEQAA